MSPQGTHQKTVTMATGFKSPFPLMRSGVVREASLSVKT